MTNRFYKGSSPLRIILDQNLRLSKKLNLYDNSVETWIITEKVEEYPNRRKTTFINFKFDNKLIFNVLDRLYEQKKSTLIVEGGAKLLSTFIDHNLWDEARIFIANKFLGDGIKAPTLPLSLIKKYKLGTDQLFIFQNDI